ncbi:MAG: hypothetical protein IJW45_02815 [Oscillospiraceae bacterium]|nr:hypothetical protein [Oscillospiraceae bacterium]
MKQFYEIAEMEIVAFEVEDVITTSGGGLINGGVGSGDSSDFSDLFPGLS